MSYASKLMQLFGKRSVWLYEIEYGGVVSRFAARKGGFTAMGEVWQESPIAHNRFRRTIVDGRAETDLIFPNSDSVAQSFLDNDSVSSLVRIYHGFEEDLQSPSPAPSPPEGQFVVKFSGRVIGVKPFLTRIILTCENEYTELRRKALAAVMQRPCRHALYFQKDGYGCGAVLSDFEANATLLQVSGNLLEVPDADAQIDGFYNGGILTWNGRRQLITKHIGYQIYLLGPVFGLEDAVIASGSTGVTVAIAPGCDRTRATCDTRFGVIESHGGYPWMSETPFDGKTLY